jgi:hypothetical protein
MYLRAVKLKLELPSALRASRVLLQPPLSGAVARRPAAEVRVVLRVLVVELQDVVVDVRRYPGSRRNADVRR